ncbi:MAG TPA: T9SS type A sorting domain-containing protein, partial [Bacteroidia bacterium]|nr:T9SS type A sorting domain-containing protein [Bacteroidia bacterium]
MNYSVNGNTPVAQTISGISGFSGLTSYNWSMNTAPYVPSAAGNITVKYWANPLNGSDTNTNTDTLVAHFLVVDSIQAKQVMYEEFSCASCDPCMHAMPNIDSVANNTVSYANNIRYHWYFPGQDMINQVTATLVNNRMSYYGQNGVPTSAIDGAIWYPGYGYLSSGVIQAARAVGSPFKIDVATAVFNTVTKTFSFSANIKSYGNFPAGLKAQVYLTEDSVDFKTDQSTEDPITSFAFDGGPNPNYYYDYVLNFPNAVEEALPSSTGGGQNLTAFTTGSTQNVTVSWTKTHPWAAKYNSYPYDSSTTQHFTIFIQDNNGNAAAGVPAQYVYQSAKVLVTDVTGLEEISNGVYFNMYPNPTNGITTLAFKLDKEQNVNVQLFNMLGQQVYSDNEGTMSSGNHTISMDGSSLQNGVYFVKFTSDNATTTQKLIIQK